MDLSLEALKRHTPLINRKGQDLMRVIAQHPSAPKWNFTCGDQLTAADHRALEQFRQKGQSYSFARKPSARWFLSFRELRNVVPIFEELLPIGMHIERDWEDIPTTSRTDFAAAVERMIPSDAPLDLMMIYATSGTTGHSILIPKTPFAVGCYHILLAPALKYHGVHLDFRPDCVGNFLLGMQTYTVMHPSIMTIWEGAGHAKINLHPNAWHNPDDCLSYLAHFNAPLLTGDPISFAELLRIAPQIKPAISPKVLLSTSLHLSWALKNALAEYFSCPVIDWYSLNETGPIAYSCPSGVGFHLLPNDLYVEILDPNGQHVPENERGEITVSGGSNAFLPLLRYRTGDSAKIAFSPRALGCTCGDPSPLLYEFEGRKTVIFRHQNGSMVNQVDIARILRDFPIVQHCFTQHQDMSCKLVVRPLQESLDFNVLRNAFQSLLGSIPLAIKIDPTLGQDQKVVPYQSSLNE